MTDSSSIFVITKSSAVIRGSISPKDIISSLTKSRGLKNINCGSTLEIIT